MDVKISVVVPIYNVEKYLDRCVESLVNQTYKNLEIILVDDGSPDNCGAICDEWEKKDNRIKVIHKQNAGLGYARNSGIEVATGDYVSFCDSDDWVSLDLYKDMASIIADYNPDVIGFGYHKCACSVPQEKIVSSIGEGMHDNSKYSVLLDMISTRKLFEGNGKKVIKTACFHLYRSELLKKNNIQFKSEREILCEDYLFNIDVFTKAVSYYITNNSYYFYDAVEGSLSHRHVKNMYERMANLLSAYKKAVAPLDLDKQLVNKRLELFWIESMYACIRNECKKISGRSYREAKANVSSILNDNFLREALGHGDCTESKKGKALVVLMKLKSTFLIYWMYKIIIGK